MNLVILNPWTCPSTVSPDKRLRNLHDPIRRHQKLRHLEMIGILHVPEQMPRIETDCVLRQNVRRVRAYRQAVLVGCIWITVSIVSSGKAMR